MALEKSVLNTILTGALTIWIAFIAVKSTYTKWVSSAADESPATRQITDWRRLTNGRKPSLGTAGARVVIIEFSDYQCSFCRALEPRLQKLVSAHAGEVVIYRYDYPQETIHPYAKTAAIAAECAQEQGIVEPYQAQLFRQSSLSDLNWLELARQVGVTHTKQFDDCLREERTLHVINEDVQKGKELGVAGTPTIIMNGSLVGRALSYDELEKLYSIANRTKN